jgi:methyltransferase (TIGR00027 family)
MPEPMTGASRGPSRSAALVAACRMLAAELPPHERLVDDPFAQLVVDDRAIAAARADESLQNTIRLRTRYIDDAVATFVHDHREERPQVLLLGAGMDARAYRMDLDADLYEVDFPATLHLKAELLAGHEPKGRRTVVPVDLAERDFVDPLVVAGFNPSRPTIVVWEGVINYLDAATAESVVEQIAGVLAPGGQLVADYVEMAWFKGSHFERTTTSIAKNLEDGGEPLKGGLRNIHATLERNGFNVLDDEATEDLRPRYGLAPRERVYPARMITASRRGT